MAFAPLQGDFSSSLLGVGSVGPIRYDETIREADPEKYFERGLHGSARSDKETQQFVNSIILIIISAFIFITIVSIFDVARVSFNNYFANFLYVDLTPREVFDKKNLNELNLESTIVFSIFCMFAALIMISVLIWMSRR